MLRHCILALGVACAIGLPIAQAQALKQNTLDTDMHRIEAVGAVVAREVLELDQVRRLYLGQDSDYLAVNLPEGHPTREQFEASIMRRTASQLREHWQRMTEMGRGLEPNVFTSDAEVLEFIQAHGQGVGYVSDIELAERQGLTVIQVF